MLTLADVDLENVSMVRPAEPARLVDCGGGDARGWLLCYADGKTARLSRSPRIELQDVGGGWHLPRVVQGG